MPSSNWREEAWPSLPLEDWSDTYATLHMWTQIVGKVRLIQSPWFNHSWHVPFYVTSTGLTTSPIPYGVRTFQIDFDFIDHQLMIRVSDGRKGGFPLRPQSVAAFYRALMDELDRLDLHIDIHKTPNEVPDALRFDQDETHKAYAQDYANRFWRILVQSDRVMKEFRAHFIGKCSPVHFFWGAPDIAVTRFSGRRAPQHPGGVPNLPDFVGPGGVLARGQQLRFLAWWRPGPVCVVLLLCVSGTTRILGGIHQAGGSILQCRSSGVHPAL
jgi:hypothetical protein